MDDTNPVELQGIQNIAISGRIGSGATTLATKVGSTLQWPVLDGGKLFRKINAELGVSIVESNKRPDHFDLAYEERIKKMFREEVHNVIQSHLAAFDAQGIEGVFKILVICEDKDGNDKPEIRIDRLINRDNVSVDDAKHEVKEREMQHLTKFRRLYAPHDPNWIYWDKRYYDLVINTYELNQEEALVSVLRAINFASPQKDL